MRALLRLREKKKPEQCVGKEDEMYTTNKPQKEQIHTHTCAGERRVSVISGSLNRQNHNDDGCDARRVVNIIYVNMINMWCTRARAFLLNGERARVSKVRMSDVRPKRASGDVVLIVGQQRLRFFMKIVVMHDDDDDCHQGKGPQINRMSNDDDH